MVRSTQFSSEKDLTYSQSCAIKVILGMEHVIIEELPRMGNNTESNPILSFLYLSPLVHTHEKNVNVTFISILFSCYR